MVYFETYYSLEHHEAILGFRIDKCRTVKGVNDVFLSQTLTTLKWLVSGQYFNNSSTSCTLSKRSPIPQLQASALRHCAQTLPSGSVGTRRRSLPTPCRIQKQCSTKLRASEVKDMRLFSKGHELFWRKSLGNKKFLPVFVLLSYQTQRTIKFKHLGVVCLQLL